MVVREVNADPPDDAMISAGRAALGFRVLAALSGIHGGAFT